MISRLILFSGLWALASLFPASAGEALPSIEAFFKDAQVSSISLSPSGAYIAVAKPEADRTVLIAFRTSDLKPLARWNYGENLHIERVRWVSDQRFFMYVSRKLGRFDAVVPLATVYASNVDGSKQTEIPRAGTYRIIDMLWDDPRYIMVARSDRSTFLAKLDVANGRLAPMVSAPIYYGSFLLDQSKQVRYAFGEQEDNTFEVLRRVGDEWEPVHRSGDRESLRQPIHVGENEDEVIFAVSSAGEPARLVQANLASGEETLIRANPNVVPDSFLYSSDGRTLLAVGYEDGLPSYDFLRPEHPESKAYAGLIKAFPQHAVRFDGISRDGRFVLLRRYSDVDSAAFYLFDRVEGTARMLLAARPWLSAEHMSPMRPVSIEARDGRTLHGYLTLPRQRGEERVPLVVNPHGGPHEVRDVWGFNAETQLLASRGYAVLQLNFRGSGGYGGSHQWAGYGEWGTSMLDDLADAVAWTIESGYVDGDRVCIYGASYGGFAALQSTVRHPELYRCAVGYVGVYSLPLMFKDGDIPSSEWGQNYLKQVLPETLAEQQKQSPAHNAEHIRVPLMLVHGGKDERVPMSQYRAMHSALEKAGRPPEVTLVAKREGHGFYALENQVDLYTKLLAFLDRHIGPGRIVRDAHAQTH